MQVVGADHERARPVGLDAMHVVVHNVPSNTHNPREASTLCARATRTLQYVRNTTGPTRNAIDSIRAASAQTNSLASHRTLLWSQVALFRRQSVNAVAGLPACRVQVCYPWLHGRGRSGCGSVLHPYATAVIAPADHRA